MVYNYSFTKESSVNGNIVFKTPKVDNFEDIKKEIKSTNDCVINHSIYPNGLDITVTQLCDRFILSSNKELARNDDGTYFFKD